MTTILEILITVIVIDIITHNDKKNSLSIYIINRLAIRFFAECAVKILFIVSAIQI